MFQVKRIYEAVSPEDGYRVLVDRIWPRGESKEKAHLDLWLKEVAPDTELRKWFGHDPEKFTAFKEKYTASLATDPEKKAAFAQLQEIGQTYSKVTLLYSAKDEVHNNADVLLELLTK